MCPSMANESTQGIYTNVQELMKLWYLQSAEVCQGSLYGKFQADTQGRDFRQGKDIQWVGM